MRMPEPEHLEKEKRKEYTRQKTEKQKEAGCQILVTWKKKNEDARGAQAPGKSKKMEDANALASSKSKKRKLPYRT